MDTAFIVLAALLLAPPVFFWGAVLIEPVWKSLFSRAWPSCSMCVFSPFCRHAAPGCCCVYRASGWFRRFRPLPLKSPLLVMRPHCVDCLSFDDCDHRERFVPSACLPFYDHEEPE